MMFDSAHASLQGNREINQDRCALVYDGNCDCVLLLLADGMGGHPRGEVAAQILIDTGRRIFDHTSKPIGDPLGFLDDVLGTAHEEIVAYGKRKDPPIDPRATAVAVLVQDGQVYWTHAGDSRFYLFRNYQILARTRDHSFVEELRHRGLQFKDAKGGVRYRNLVTQCLGGSGMRFGTTRGLPTPLKPRDILLLCTDGLWGQIPDTDLKSMMRHHGSLERMVNQLAEIAAQNGAPSSDNVTLLALRWPEEQDATDSAEQPMEAPAEDSEEVKEAMDHLRAVIEEFDTDS